MKELGPYGRKLHPWEKRNVKPLYDYAGIRCPDGTPCYNETCCNSNICQRTVEPPSGESR